MNIRPLTDRAGLFLLWRAFSKGEVRPNGNTGSSTERRALYAEEDFLHHFEQNTKKYGFWGLILPLFLFVLDAGYCGIVPNLLPGLVMELFGAWALARVLFMDPSMIRDVSTAGWGGPSPEFRKVMAIDAAEGIWGITLLTLGIIQQSLIAVGFTVSTTLGC